MRAGEIMGCYLDTGNKAQCFGCEACVQICGRRAISMAEDVDGFRYPVIQPDLCIDCGLCSQVCPNGKLPACSDREKYAFGGYHLDEDVREKSTSGGAFSAIVEAFCDENYVIFGAKAESLQVFHSYITDKNALDVFRRSKYSQSQIGTAYQDVKAFLRQGKKVLFSGTPCQIAGLAAYLGNSDMERLLTVEVVCEGVPSPHYMRKKNLWMEKKYGSRVQDLEYRFKDGKKWDFQVMYTKLKNGKRIKVDRWFNPFWSIWLSHLMSRPSCYQCPFTTQQRGADITLGDLWGVHLYCPDLYGKNAGASLVVCNTEKGETLFRKAQSYMYGRELAFSEALKYQSPMRKCISENPLRDEFMADLRSDMSYHALNRKWAKKPTIKLLWQKYVWGNRQKVALWNLHQRRRKDTKC